MYDLLFLETMAVLKFLMNNYVWSYKYKNGEFFVWIPKL